MTGHFDSLATVRASADIGTVSREVAAWQAHRDQFNAKIKALFALSVESRFLADPPGLESLTRRGKRVPHVVRTLVVHSI